MARDSQRAAAKPHSFIGPVITQIFEEIDVGAGVWDKGRWHGIHWRSDLLEFEMEHRVEARREAHNARCLSRVRKQRAAVLAEHAGFFDLFTPITVGGKVDAVIVTGPFARSQPSSAEILGRWRDLTSRQGHPVDPEFMHYVSATLGALVLDDRQLVDLRRLASCLARAMAGEGSPAEICAEVEALRPRLTAARFVDRVWAAGRSMVDERTSRVWASPVRAGQRVELGLTRFPEHVAVGLLVNHEGDVDPVDEFLRRHAWQRHCVEVVQKFGGAVSGQVGDHGVSFLAENRGSSLRSERRLIELVELSARNARRKFGLTLHFGVSTLSVSLSLQYQAALSAAESALSQGIRLVRAEPGATVRDGAPDLLSRLRRELATLVERNPRELPAHFDRFLEAIAARSGYRMELVRAHLEAGFERIAEVVLGSGALDEKGLADLRATLSRSAAAAVTVSELFARYRAGLGDLIAAVERPSNARHDRNLRRVEEYLGRNYAAPLSLIRVARVAGFAPHYFSELFRRKQGTTLEQYISNLRLTRARELLSSTTLSVDRVAKLSGFSSGHYLARVFKRSTRQTPLAFRKRASLRSS